MEEASKSQGRRWEEQISTAYLRWTPLTFSQQSDTDVKITKFRVNCETPKTRGLVLSGLINREFLDHC